MTAISLTSRYQLNKVGVVLSRTGRPRLAILHRMPDAMLMRVVEHLWTAYDRIDVLAARYYGNETSWWMIAQANPTILDWTSVNVGTVIRIPRGS